MPAHEADASWLEGLGGYTHLRLCRRLDFTTVTTSQVVREGLAQVKATVEACPALAAMLHDSGQLQPRAQASSPVSAASSA